MAERFLVSLIPAAVLVAVIVYSVWRDRHESAARLSRIIAESNAHTMAILERWRLKAAATFEGEAHECLPHAPEPAIAPIRKAFGALVRDDDLALLRQTLGGGQAVEDVGRALGLTPDQSRTRFADALRRLCAFAEVAEAQGFASDDVPTA